MGSSTARSRCSITSLSSASTIISAESSATASTKASPPSRLKQPDKCMVLCHLLSATASVPWHPQHQWVRALFRPPPKTLALHPTLMAHPGFSAPQRPVNTPRKDRTPHTHSCRRHRTARISRRRFRRLNSNIISSCSNHLQQAALLSTHHYHTIAPRLPSNPDSHLLPQPVAHTPPLPPSTAHTPPRPLFRNDLGLPA